CSGPPSTPARTASRRIPAPAPAAVACWWRRPTTATAAPRASPSGSRPTARSATRCTRPRSTTICSPSSRAPTRSRAGSPAPPTRRRRAAPTCRAPATSSSPACSSSSQSVALREQLVVVLEEALDHGEDHVAGQGVPDGERRADGGDVVEAGAVEGDRLGAGGGVERGHALLAVVADQAVRQAEEPAHRADACHLPVGAGAIRREAHPAGRHARLAADGEDVALA